jgi:acyl dehydratase
MKISSKFVGVALKEYRCVVNWRDTMNYAAAIDDNNVRYFNDEQESGIVAPPMFSVAATWSVVENLKDYVAADDFPFEVLRTQVHFSESLEFHAAIKPGDELRIKGVIAAILPHRAGTHIILRFDAANQDGQPIFTEHFGGLLRGVSCEDGGAGGETLAVTPASPETNQNLWEQTVRIDALRPFIYDGCTNIFFPIHTSRKFAHDVGLPDILLQGTATLAYAARELLNHNGNGDPSSLQALSCRFTGMVFPNTDIKVQLLACTDHNRHSDLFFRVLGGQGQVVIKDGYARMEKARTDKDMT